MLSCAQTPGGWAAGATPGSRRGRAFLADCHGGGGGGGQRFKLSNSFLPKGKFKSSPSPEAVFYNVCPENMPEKGDHAYSPGRVEPIFYLVFHLGKCVGIYGTYGNSLASLLGSHVIHLCLPK